MMTLLGMQARFPLIARVASNGTDAANGTATEPGGPNRFLLQANYTGSCLHMLRLILTSTIVGSPDAVFLHALQECLLLTISTLPQQL